MKKWIKLLGCTFLVLTTLLTNISAEESTITYEGDSKEFVFDSKGNPLENLFVGCENMMPGDSITTTVKVKISVAKEEECEIFLMSLGLQDEDVKEIFKNLQITVVEKKDRKKIFESPEDPTDLSDWVSLGKFTGSGEVTLEITLTLPIECGNEVAGAIGNYDWVFKAEHYEKIITPDDDPSSPIAPDTGDRLYQIACIVAPASLAGIVLLLIFKKKNEERNEK